MKTKSSESDDAMQPMGHVVEHGDGSSTTYHPDIHYSNHDQDGSGSGLPDHADGFHAVVHMKKLSESKGTGPDGKPMFHVHMKMMAIRPHNVADRPGDPTPVATYPTAKGKEGTVGLSPLLMNQNQSKSPGFDEGKLDAAAKQEVAKRT